MSYQDLYARWKADPEAFWMQAADAVDWTAPPSRAFFDQGPAGEWFADGMVNTCWNAVDRHVAAGHGDRLAVIHDSPMTHSVSRLTYAQLQDQVARLAGVLAARGIGKGDRVIIYMPMIPEALQAMLACARIGAIHSVVFGGFAAHELAVRIDDARPRAIIAASCGLEPGRVVPYKPLMDRAIAEAAHKPDFTIVFQRPDCVAEMVAGRDLDWTEAVAAADPVDCVPVEGNHPAYILYTSGTTGQPKGVVRHTAGHLVALAWSVPHIYDIGPGEVFWVASDVGWVVGHSYIVYGPLIAGATTVVFEGKPVGTPDAGTFWRVVADHKVKSFFTAPTAIRAVKRDDPEGKLVGQYDLSSLKAMFLAGERADPDTVTWAEERLKVPVIDHWWQTETGWAIAANPLGVGLMPIRKGSPTLPMPGYDVQVLDEGGHPVAPGTLGAIAIRLPLPPGTLPTLWNAEDRFRRAYLDHFPGFYETGDAGYVDEDGYVWIMARTDDVINVAGHRLSTGGMEEVLAAHPAVAECAVIGVADALKGQAPLGLLCLKKGVETDPAQITAEVVRMVRDRIGPVAAFKTACVVDRLPKTRSGKILRATMAKIADGCEVVAPATIDDPAILDEIRAALAGVGYPVRA
ncbi:propionyl-CoA synthetase [Paracoccus liaowanqingii]|uniref:Propionyl-CoA synthetase n=1 Tax=Paracoccus liaowanqingii TaxID=2560053 RepID=A0A4P7HLD0_9RHOB|nr:propionyl-CoA synthetase [Paracoccus liaowanqingii]QBX34460.1 propionyl-CoA synthetase [Paracoccus liaowanqingii]